jgi:hypothetical protein
MPLPSLKTQCGVGHGLAACPALGLLVIAEIGASSLLLWGLPGGAIGGASRGAVASAGAFVGGVRTGGGDGLTLVCTLGGAGSVAPMQFKFAVGGGRLAFLPATSSGISPLLLVTDAGADAVHLQVAAECGRGGSEPRGVRRASRVHCRAPGRGGEWGLAPGGRQRVEEGRQR